MFIHPINIFTLFFFHPSFVSILNQEYKEKFNFSLSSFCVMIFHLTNKVYHDNNKNFGYSSEFREVYIMCVWMCLGDVDCM